MIRSRLARRFTEPQHERASDLLSSGSISYSASLSAGAMANLNCCGDQILPDVGVDYDYVGATDGYRGSPIYVGP